MPSAIDEYRVAAIQFDPVLGAKAANIARLLALTETAAAGGARLIVLPEMATTGCCWRDRDEIRPHVEPIPGPTTDAFADLALRYDCYIVIGMPEIAPHTGSFYNSAALVGPDGVVGVYRKTHCFAGDMTWARNGDRGPRVWNTPLGRIGIMICMDAGYVEPARLLALAGADVLCFPTNWLGEKSPGPAWMTRAWENGCYLIAADRYGLERGIQFSGGSCVLNPDGTIQAMQDTGDGVVWGEVALSASRGGRSSRPEKLALRRPELYDNLTLSHYLWNPIEFHAVYSRQPLPPGRRSQVAVVQFAPSVADLQGNLRQIEDGLGTLCDQRADETSIDLVVFPEYALTGSPRLAHPHAAIAADGAWRARLVELARRYRVQLVVGYAERDGGHCFSSALLVGPDGPLAHYRKTHVVAEEAAWCTPGSEKPPVRDLPLGRVGLLIGSDLGVPEVARSLAIAGCDLLVVPASPGLPPSAPLGPTAIPVDGPGIVADDRHHFHLARQRAIENNCYLAFASLPHPGGIGASAVFGPTPAYRVGQSILDPDAVGTLVRAVDTATVDDPYATLASVRAKDLVRTRQPHLYDPLIARGDDPPGSTGDSSSNVS
jgi:predicted amidohydrolase